MAILTPEEFFAQEEACGVCALPAEVRSAFDNAVGKHVRGIPLGARRLLTWLDDVQPGHGLTRAQLDRHIAQKHSA